MLSNSTAENCRFGRLGYGKQKERLGVVKIEVDRRKLRRRKRKAQKLTFRARNKEVVIRIEKGLKSWPNIRKAQTKRTIVVWRLVKYHFYSAETKTELLTLIDRHLS